MNKLNKYKVSSLNITADESSDNDVKVDVETIQQGHIDSRLASMADSNDSFYLDNDSMSNDRRVGSKSLNIKNIMSTPSSRPIDESRLNECLNYIHSTICKKDREEIFGLPVTDDIAPGYSLIIKKPMDLSLMKTKIDTFVYRSIMEYREDLILMCENCMTYNNPDTIYYQAARKLLEFGLKLLSREKIQSLRTTVRIMRYLTSEELGYPIEMDTNDIDTIVNSVRQRAHQIQQKTFTHSFVSRLASSSNLILPKLKPDPPKESYLLPPEGENNEYAEDIADQVKEAARRAAEKLAIKNKKGRMGFVRRNSNGTIQMNFLGKSEDSESQERILTIGNLYEGLQAGSYSMSSFIEEKKNKTKPMHFIENGPFSTTAPTYDNTYTTIPKEEAEFLTLVYGDEAAYQYALSMMEFSKNTTQMHQKYVNLVLNTLTNNEHEKYLAYLAKKQQQVQQQQQSTTTPIKQESIATSSSTPPPATEETTPGEEAAKEEATDVNMNTENVTESLVKDEVKTEESQEIVESENVVKDE